tara:strand:- start:238 stop:441 length:204 start_codon:yes stop_codon:yes gene_type:complete
MGKKKLKLYVWEGVLSDYTDGCMFALAENAEDARNLIEEKMKCRTGYLDIEPKEITEREGFYVYGGG